MTVTNVEKDAESRTLKITTDLEARIDRVWQMWADPRLLEQWWGPPSHPATFEDFDLKAGERVNYFMTGPDGEKRPDSWIIKTVEAPHVIEIKDGNPSEEENPAPGISLMRIDINEIDDAAGSTRMTITTTYDSVEDMENLIKMGMEEGLKQGIGQIDALL